MSVNEIYEETVDWRGKSYLRYKCERHDKVVYSTESHAIDAARKVGQKTGHLFKAHQDVCGHWHIKGPRKTRTYR
jgi:ABC-type nickel/cobalt efflux system permease component RcnA